MTYHTESEYVDYYAIRIPPRANNIHLFMRPVLHVYWLITPTINSLQHIIFADLSVQIFIYAEKYFVKTSLLSNSITC